MGGVARELCCLPVDDAESLHEKFTEWITVREVRCASFGAVVARGFLYLQ